MASSPSPVAKTPGRKPFYAEGVRFECQGSGRCCTSRGTYGFVYLTEKDQDRFAAFFKMTRPEFISKYCNRKNGHVALKNPSELRPPMVIENDGDCIFLDENRCAAYEGRPEQCRTWPFWPENMNAKTWKTEIAAYCPGVGKGKLHTFEEIKKILDEQES